MSDICDALPFFPPGVFRRPNASPFSIPSIVGRDIRAVRNDKLVLWLSPALIDVEHHFRPFDLQPGLDEADVSATSGPAQEEKPPSYA